VKLFFLSHPPHRPITQNPDKAMKPKPDKKKKNILLDNLLGGERRRHQVAMITEEGEWNQHESNNGMARVFLIMLLVHVGLIGSIIVYDFIGTDSGQPAPAPSAVTSAPKNSLPTPAKTPPVVAVAPSELAIPSTEDYRVQSGDSLPSIAARRGVDLADLIKLNQLDTSPTELKPGTVLKIPSRQISEPAKYATVKEFPTTQIGQETPKAGNILPIETTPPTFKEVASVATPAIATPVPPASTPPVAAPATPPAAKPEAPKTVAQVPTPPRPTPAPPKATPAASSSVRSHTMSKGDTLYSLSRKYGVNVNAIQKANNITNPNAIREGTKLTIPAK